MGRGTQNCSTYCIVWVVKQIRTLKSVIWLNMCMYTKCSIWMLFKTRYLKASQIWEMQLGSCTMLRTIQTYAKVIKPRVLSRTWAGPDDITLHFVFPPPAFFPYQSWNCSQWICADLQVVRRFRVHPRTSMWSSATRPQKGYFSCRHKGFHISEKDTVRTSS